MWQLRHVHIAMYDLQIQWISVSKRWMGSQGLSLSYLGIHACFFDPSSYKPIHATLNVSQLPHPHTQAWWLQLHWISSLLEWEITAEKMLMVVSDNGANVVKAITLLQMRETSKLRANAENVKSEHETVESSESTITMRPHIRTHPMLTLRQHLLHLL